MSTKSIKGSMKRMTSKNTIFGKSSSGDIDWRGNRANSGGNSKSKKKNQGKQNKGGQAPVSGNNESGGGGSSKATSTFASNETAEKSKTTFNNQNTIVMLALTKTKSPKETSDIMMMHDTRIFYFSLDKTTPKWVDVDEANEGLVNIMLGMLTKKKYRILSTFYLLFRLSDNTILLALVISLFLGNQDLTEIITKNFRVFTVLGVELFYGVMEYTVKVWILNRVSLYVGFVLYGLYALAFSATGLWAPIVHILYWCRFLSFACEVITDYCIDKEISYDLYHEKITNLNLWGNRLYKCIRDNCTCDCCFGKTEEDTSGQIELQVQNNKNNKKQQISQDSPTSPDINGDIIHLSPPVSSVNSAIHSTRQTVIATIDDKVASPVSDDIELVYSDDTGFPDTKPALKSYDSFSRFRHPDTYNREIVGTDRINLPTGWTYRGSMCSWTLKNAFRPKYEKNYTPYKVHRWWFSFMLLVTLILGFSLLVIVALLAACLGGLYVCCKECNKCREKKGKDPLCQNTICGEFWQEYSF